MTRDRRLLVLASYPRSAAATRFRACEYFPALRARGIEPELWPFMDDVFMAGFYSHGRRVSKALQIAKFTLHRLAQIVPARAFDAVLVQREAAILGPAIFESVLARRFRIPLVFDFDDAVWLHDSSGSRYPLASRLLKHPQKTVNLLRMATEVVVATKYLALFARQHNSQVSVLPTVVSRAAWTPMDGRLDGRFASSGRPPTIGWVGTHSTATHLDIVLPALKALAREGRRFRVRLVGAARTMSIDGVDVESVPWRAETEIDDFRNIDIGIAPVADTEFARGKGGFKQIQYMSVGVPFVSSPVGGAVEFLDHGVIGMVANTEAEWIECLRRLLGDQALRARLAQAGRALVCRELCAEVQSSAFVGVIERSMRQRLP
jgi:glycosyltransferase involved in cell wall biosynthesis